MQFSGSVEIPAARAAVWAFLMDFEKVAACGPDVESVERLDATHARVRAKVGVGFITARFNVELELADVVAPDAAAIRARGEAPGNRVEGEARMRLSGEPGGPTTMDWVADVAIFGSLAGVGTRFIEGAATKLIGQTFECITARLAEA